MRALDRWQEAITDNLSSGTVNGYKRKEVNFESAPGGAAANQIGQPGDPASMVFPRPGLATDFSSGQIKPTAHETDLAIQGKGFFQVELPDGTLAYTRDGEFKWDTQGQLVTKEGYLVMGQGGPIQRDPNNPAPMVVATNGDVSQGNQKLGQLNIVEFNDPQLLDRLSGSYYSADSAGIQSQVAEDSRLRQGYLETSNASSIKEMVNMMTAMRLFEANQKVIQSNDQRMSRTITSLGNPHQ